MNRLYYCGLVILGFLSGQSCASVTEPTDLDGLGFVMTGTPPMTSLIAPETAQRGVSFAITASTFGSSSCTHPNGYSLAVTASRIEVRLYDNYDPSNNPCTADLRRFPREVLLRIDEVGTVRLVVTGRGSDRKISMITQDIAVLP